MAKYGEMTMSFTDVGTSMNLSQCMANMSFNAFSKIKFSRKYLTLQYFLSTATHMTNMTNLSGPICICINVVSSRALLLIGSFN